MPSETSTTTTTTDLETSSIYSHLSEPSSSSSATTTTETSPLDDLHTNLLFSLQRTGWTERIQSLTLDLLRAGRCSKFDDLVDVVVTLAAGETHPTVPESNTLLTNGHSTTNGASSNGAASVGGFSDVDVRIPKEVVEQGVKALKDAIRPIATIEGDDEPDPPLQSEGMAAEKKPGKTNTKLNASPSKNTTSKEKKGNPGK